MVSGQVDCCTVFTRGCLTCLLICFFEESLLPHDINSRLCPPISYVYIFFPPHVQHISAPHIYGAVLEALDLQPNSSHAFLCIGSGTGYLCAIAAEIMGPKSLNFGKRIYVYNTETCGLMSTLYGSASVLTTKSLFLMYLVSFLAMLWKVLKFTAM